MSLIEYRLTRAVGDLRTGLANLQRLREALAAAEREIAEGPVSTPDMKDLELREARRRIGTRVEQEAARVEEAKKDLARAIDDGWRGRTISSDARSRVRNLLAAGTAPGDLIATAVKTRDPETLAALRAEAPWHKIGDLSLDTPAVLGAIDEAMLGVGDPGDQDLAKAAGRLSALSETADRSIRLTLAEASNRPAARERIALGLAQSQAEEVG